VEEEKKLGRKKKTAGQTAVDKKPILGWGKI